jgi:hypothetical protein
MFPLPRRSACSVEGETVLSRLLPVTGLMDRRVVRS